MADPITREKATERKISLYMTKDYAIFKYLAGNRPISKSHVAKLKKKIEEEGNLTSEFPINVNEDMYVIDGQHRIEALRQLRYPVYYTVTKGAGLNVVRNINLNRRNWNWFDYASSYAQEGNTHYKDLLDFYEIHPKLTFRTLIRYCNGGKAISTSEYQAGDFKVADRGLAFGLFNHLEDVLDVIPTVNSGPFAHAMYSVFTHPEYDHKRMVSKMSAYGSQLKNWSKQKDWLRNIEDIYNYGFQESGKVRFF